MKRSIAAALLLCAVSASAGEVIQKEIVSVCRFSSAEGVGEAKFTVQYIVVPEDRNREEIRVLSALALAGRSISASGPSCYGHRRTGLRCGHGEYELRPAIVGETEKADGLRLFKVVDGQLNLLAQSACQ